MKLPMIIGLIIIFICMFSIHFVFNSYIRVSELCIQEVCEPEITTPLFIFSMFIISAFVLIIESTIYLMLKEIQMEVSLAKKEIITLESRIKELQKKRKEIMKSKKIIQKKYYKREIDEASYKKLKEGYDQTLVQTEMEIGNLKVKLSKKFKWL